MGNLDHDLRDILQHSNDDTPLTQDRTLNQRIVERVISCGKTSGIRHFSPRTLLMKRI